MTWLLCLIVLGSAMMVYGGTPREIDPTSALDLYESGSRSRPPRSRTSCSERGNDRAPSFPRRQPTINLGDAFNSVPAITERGEEDEDRCSRSSRSTARSYRSKSNNALDAHSTVDPMSATTQFNHHRHVAQPSSSVSQRYSPSLQTVKSQGRGSHGYGEDGTLGYTVQSPSPSSRSKSKTKSSASSNQSISDYDQFLNQAALEYNVGSRPSSIRGDELVQSSRPSSIRGDELVQSSHPSRLDKKESSNARQKKFTIEYLDDSGSHSTLPYPPHLPKVDSWIQDSVRDAAEDLKRLSLFEDVCNKSSEKVKDSSSSRGLNRLTSFGSRRSSVKAPSESYSDDHEEGFDDTQSRELDDMYRLSDMQGGYPQSVSESAGSTYYEPSVQGMQPGSWNVARPKESPQQNTQLGFYGGANQVTQSWQLVNPSEMTLDLRLLNPQAYEALHRSYKDEMLLTIMKTIGVQVFKRPFDHPPLSSSNASMNYWLPSRLQELNIGETVSQQLSCWWIEFVMRMPAHENPEATMKKLKLVLTFRRHAALTTIWWTHDQIDEMMRQFPDEWHNLLLIGNALNFADASQKGDIITESQGLEAIRKMMPIVEPSANKSNLLQDGKWGGSERKAYLAKNFKHQNGNSLLKVRIGQALSLEALKAKMMQYFETVYVAGDVQKLKIHPDTLALQEFVLMDWANRGLVAEKAHIVAEALCIGYHGYYPSKVRYDRACVLYRAIGNAKKDVELQKALKYFKNLLGSKKFEPMLGKFKDHYQTYAEQTKRMIVLPMKTLLRTITGTGGSHFVSE